MTLDPASGTNLFWGFGDNTYGELGITPTVGIGNAANNPNSCGSEEFVSIPTNVQFCTRCQREVQLTTKNSNLEPIPKPAKSAWREPRPPDTDATERVPPEVLG
jgi:hypothetical protein